MRTPAIDVLEVALSLRREPGGRFRLRERPLPDGLVQVMEVAAAAPQAVYAAAAELGEEPAYVLEAARFYLEQVLFAVPDADAYRILGASREASQETLRLHHRWLQRWLHPDRAQAGDSAVFATRVNQAWSQLRTPELRLAYDVRQAGSRLADAAAPLSASTLRQWEYVEPKPGSGGRSRWLAAVALTACLVLAVLVVRHEDPEVSGDRYPPAVADVDAEPIPLVANSGDPLSRAFAQSAAGAATHPAERNRVEPATARPDTAAPPAIEPALPRPPHTIAVARSDVSPAEAARPAPKAIAAAEPAPPPPVFPATVPAAPASVPAVIDARIASRPALEATAVEMAAPAPGAPATSVASAEQQGADNRLLLERMRLAESRLSQVTAYIAADPRAAPLWNDVQTQSSADDVRQRIASRGGGLQFARPRWELQRDSASIEVDYRCRACGLREGRLEVKLVWREGLWLVRGVGLEPSA